MNCHARKTGFTLVELLIVTGLLGTLLALLLAGFRANEDTDIRRAANALASAIRHTQTLAMNNPQGAALVIVAARTGAPTTNISHGDVLPTILATGSLSSFSPLVVASTGTVSLRALASGTVVLNADGVGPGYQIRFSSSGIYGPWGPWFGFSPAPSISGTLWSGTVSLQPSLAQSGTTVVTPLPSTTLSCELAQRPIKTQVLSFPKLAVIDTRWSGIGNDIDTYAPFVSGAIATGSLTITGTTSPYRNSLLSLAQGTSTGFTDIALCFDRTGGLASVLALPSVGNATQPYTHASLKPSSPIYFLVTGALAAASASTALDVVQSASPIWVAIDPATGAVQTGKNQPPGMLDMTGVGTSRTAAASRIDAYFRSLRTNVFSSPFIEAGR